MAGKGLRAGGGDGRLHVGCMVVGPRVRAAVGYEARECQGARRLACAMGCQLLFLRRETRDERQETEGSKSEPVAHLKSEQLKSE